MNDIETDIRDYLNGYLKEQELFNKCNLKRCDRCEQVERERDLELSINDDWICESCRDDL